MDSLSQIVLGAAVGEAVLGRKIGNRAMLWGAFAGTVPDLDVVSNLWMNELESLAFHRGISHSLFFAVLASFFLAGYTRWLYSSGTYRGKTYRQVSGWLGIILVGLVGAGLVAGVYQLGSGAIAFGLCAAAVAGLGYIASRTYRYYIQPDQVFDIEVSYWEWYLFFFLAVFTHPILDCCTVYGTQLWAPFSSVRVAWGHISVADPLWTLPFGLCLLVVGFCARTSRARRGWLWAGWVISMAYMLFTVSNQRRAMGVLADTLSAKGIVAEKMMVTPTILNNVLWSATVKVEGGYYQGLYSFLDRERAFDLQYIPANLDLVDDDGSDHTLNTLKWFSDGYYAYLRRKDGRLQMNDLRYGAINAQEEKGEDDYVFRFVLQKNGNGYELGKSLGGPPRGKENELAKTLWNRMLGKE